jgi:hypothetical protein
MSAQLIAKCHQTTPARLLVGFVRLFKKYKKVDGFRFLGARALVSSHANGETSENNRAGREAPARASPEFTA